MEYRNCLQLPAETRKVFRLLNASRKFDDDTAEYLVGRELFEKPLLEPNQFKLIQFI